MLYSVFALYAVLASATSAKASAVAFNKSTPTTWTFTGTAVVLQTPTPTAIAVSPKHGPSTNGNLTTQAAQVASLPFFTNCCGWAGVYGWTAAGSSVATMNGVCLSPIVSSSLDLNTCLGWDSSTGSAGCPNTGQPKGGFLSTQAGCKVVGAPNVLSIGSVGFANTMIYTICNGPPGVLVITALDLSLCVGITSGGQLACYN
ncbi:hypothetical protein BDN70DRAFT_992459 [Pholiota conissans]|uniref:Cyanovirin-N domain-containing protein n=1 Tax=Pholiota conissans TaxID=109636 RepID=A0A9P5Z633_9AGAR|nr:hypothetical protein BDN70DRAFT_992459 [Pholiota conissans]